MLTPEQALHRMMKGNKRFVHREQLIVAYSSRRRLATQLREQSPFAVVLGCSDSRVPAEIVFDQGVGDLFVVRVAGNIATPTQIGSVEYAVENFESPLVVVLGHTYCGAIQGALAQITEPALSRASQVTEILRHIRPAVEPWAEQSAGAHADASMSAAVRANVRASVSNLRSGSALLTDLEAQGLLMIVGAEYNLETSEVDFFDYQENQLNDSSLKTS